MSDPKRHHYNPAFYLAGFTRERRRNAPFAVYDREKDDFRTQTPDSSAFQRFFYATETATAERDLSTEKLFAEIENASKPLIDRLEQGESISDDDRATLAVFFALLHTRVPQAERRFNEVANLSQKTLNRMRFASVDDVRAAMREHEQQGQEPIETSPEEAFAMLTSEEYIFAPHRNETIAMMLRLGVEMGEHLNRFTWHVIHTEPEAQFLAIDAPLVALPPPNWDGYRGYGFLTPGVMSVLPLTSRCAVFFEDTGASIDHRIMPADGVHINNKGIVSHSERYIFARDRKYLEQVVIESRLAEIPLRQPVVVIGDGA